MTPDKNTLTFIDMDHNKLKTKAELSTEIGVSRATLYRMLEKMNIETKRGLLPPDDQDRIRAAFGLKPLEKGSGDRHCCMNQALIEPTLTTSSTG